MQRRIFDHKLLPMGSNISIQKTEDSQINAVDFTNLPFGRVFSDHMFIADYNNGKWVDPRIVPFQNLEMHPAMSAIHYGQSIFEGLKAYRSDDDSVSIFRPDMNIARLNRSAARMAMPAFPEDLFFDAIDELFRLDHEWAPKTEGGSLYIRPFMFATDEYIGIKSADNYRFVMFTCPVLSYYSAPVKVKIADHYVRAVHGGTGDAKCAGNYAATLYPAAQAREEGFDQILWTDAYEFKYVQEIGTMNVFFVIGDTVVTPKLADTILAGVTRDSAIKLLKRRGYKVEERDVSVDELIAAHKAGTLKEAFGAGTAATISQIIQLGYKDERFDLPAVETRKISGWLAETLQGIKSGELEDPDNWVYAAWAADKVSV